MLTCVDCVVPPPIPVIVKVIVPGVTEEVVVTLRMEVNGGAPKVGFKDVDTPGGAPVMLKATFWGLPETGFTVIV
jgi:hypothetical protein